MRKSILKIYTCLGLAAGAYWIWFKMTELGLPCYYLTVHGYECPGCGLTRMVFSMLQLQFGRAFLYNPVGFLAFLLVGKDQACKIACRFLQPADCDDGRLPDPGTAA